MSKSTQVLTDLATTAAATPTAATIAKATSATGPITMVSSLAQVIQEDARELLNKMNALKAACDAGDTGILTTLQQVIDVFV